MQRSPSLLLLVVALFSVGCQWLPKIPVQPSPTPSAAPTQPVVGRIYVTDRDSRVLAIRTDQDLVAERFPVEDGAGGVATSPDGLFLYATAKTKDYLRIFQTSGALVGRLGTGKEPAGIDISRDGSRLYVANKGDDTISVLDPRHRKSLKTIPTGHQPMAVAVSNNGKMLYVLAHADNEVLAYDASSGKEKARATVPTGPFSLALDPKGKYLYVSSFDANQVSVLDTSTLAEVAVVKVGDGAYDLVASRDGQIYVSCVEEGAVVQFPYEDWSSEPKATPVGSRPYGLALSADESQLFVALEGDSRLAVLSLPGLQNKTSLDLGVIPVDVFNGR